MAAYSELLLAKYAQFREQDEFIDVRLKVGEEAFSAHRIVLAASSDYFHAMFVHDMKEANQEVIELKDENISAAALKNVLDSIYSGNFTAVNDENVFEVLVAADHLQVTSVVQQCCEYLQTEFVQLRSDMETYCRICTIADRHGLKDLQEATQRNMASRYKEVCESEEFLSNIDADQLSNLVLRDDLSSPSETFVFRSVMQWIKYKKEERMSTAAKVIGAVRLGLVDIKDVIRELSPEEMKQVPEIQKLLLESLLYNQIPSSSSFSGNKTALPRSNGPVVVAVLSKSHMQYFDVEAKAWKLLTTLAPAPQTKAEYPYAVLVGCKLFVGGDYSPKSSCVHYYDIERNVWEKLNYPHGAAISNLCRIGDYMYPIMSYSNQILERYNLAECRWQRIEKLNMSQKIFHYFYNSGGTVLNSNLFVLYAHVRRVESSWQTKNAVLHCFDPLRNRWEKKSSTCHPQLGSSLFVVSGKMYVAGGFDSYEGGKPCGKPAPVEVYDEENNTWSVVKQSRIPPNDLGAVEIEGRVYFIINRFPIDSGIRIPPGELYPVHLDEWQNLGKVDKTAALCYMPLKRESLNVDRTDHED